MLPRFPVSDYLEVRSKSLYLLYLLWIILVINKILLYFPIVHSIVPSIKQLLNIYRITGQKGRVDGSGWER